jgi:hypothetical protein
MSDLDPAAIMAGIRERDRMIGQMVDELIAYVDRLAADLAVEQEASAQIVREAVAERDQLRSDLAAERAKVQRIQALPPSIDGSGGKAWVIAWGDLCAALAGESAAESKPGHSRTRVCSTCGAPCRLGVIRCEVCGDTEWRWVAGESAADQTEEPTDV